MFWNRKKKLPITEVDQIWVEDSLRWLRKELGEELFMKIETVTPTSNFYDRTFDSTEDDARFILERTKELMGLKKTRVKLRFFSDSPIQMDDGTTLSTPADIEGKWNSAAGTFQQRRGKTIISIERQQLKNPISLIATIAHELAHEILLGQNRIEENDEYLTDLTAIAYGFGIFIGNARFEFSASGFGWQSSGQGYLPEQVIAYAMASLSKKRNEKTDYTQFLDKSLKRYFDQSSDWLAENEKT